MGLGHAVALLVVTGQDDKGHDCLRAAAYPLFAMWQTDDDRQMDSAPRQAKHVSHPDAPGDEKLPVPHGAHTDAPTREKVPAAHMVQVDPGLAYIPAAHGVQWLENAAETVPATHGLHKALPTAE